MISTIKQKRGIQTMRETVLLFHFDDSNQKRELQMLLLSMKIKTKSIEKKDYHKPLGVLAGVLEEGDHPEYEGDDLDTESMIFCGLSNARLNEVLNGIRKKKIKPIPYKAILTPTNQHWTILECYQELRREHAAMEAARAASAAKQTPDAKEPNS